MFKYSVRLQDEKIYRKDIDGLRAVAVVSVVLFHYNLGYAIPGGFTGVDVFFVISGFLITSILQRDIEDGRFSLVRFYDRRFRRILPALLVVLLISVLLGYVLEFPSDYASSSESAAYAAFGASNFFFYWHTGYFDRSADFLPLLHTWSLGVEEQFYLVGPASFYLISRTLRHRKAPVAIVIAGLMTASFAAGLYLLTRNPKAAFYFPHTRAWELAMGALLVFLPALSRNWGEIANVCGLTLIGIGLFTISPAQPFPGWNALLPCVGAALVAWPKRPSWTGHCLGLFRSLGLISYSLYLWHWPIWVFYRIYINNEAPTAAEGAALVALSLILSWLSFRYIEQPFRKVRPWPWLTVGTGLIASAALAGVALMVVQTDGLKTRIPASVVAAQLPAARAWPSCVKSAPLDAPPVTCVFGPAWNESRNKGIVWGDSHSMHVASLLEPFAKDSDTAMALYYNCPAIVDAKIVNEYYAGDPNYSTTCAAHRSAMLGTLSAHREINLVVLAASWSYLPSIMYQDTPSTRGGDMGLHLFEQALDATVSAIEIPGRRIVLVGSVPQWSRPPTTCLLASVLPRTKCVTPTMSYAEGMATLEPTYTIISNVAKHHSDTIAILPALAMCKSGNCIAQLDDEFLTYDAGHIRLNLRPDTKRDLGLMIGLDRAFDQLAPVKLLPVSGQSQSTGAH